jgi:SagB-type dehydrogenase family enzyme
MKYFLELTLLCFILGTVPGCAQPAKIMEKDVLLPAPKLKGRLSLEQAINQRRSKRRFSAKELSLAQISQLLWSAQGITSRDQGFRAAPSAGALYPMEIYLVGKDGLFHYLPESHKLEQLISEDLRQELARACLDQGCVAQAPVDIVIAAVYERVSSRYGQRGRRYTDMEAGHIAQNIHLQAVALGLGSVSVGAFNERAVKRLLVLTDDEQPLYVIPIGYAQ